MRSKNAGRWVLTMARPRNALTVGSTSSGCRPVMGEFLDILDEAEQKRARSAGAEITRTKGRGRRVEAALVVERIRGLLMPMLRGETVIAGPHSPIRDQRRNRATREGREIGLAMVARIRGDQRRRRAQRRHRGDDGEQAFLLGARASTIICARASRAATPV